MGDEIHLDDGDEAIIIEKEEWKRFKSYNGCPICKSMKNISLRITFTGMAPKVEVVCGECGWFRDITNYEKW